MVQQSQNSIFFGQAFQDLRLNERRALQVLRRMGTGSKADIARVTNLTNAAVGTIVKSLEDKGLIISGKKVYEGQRGQPATMMHLNPTGAYGIGVRLERNFIQTVLIDFDGNLLSRFTNEMLLPDPQTTLEIVCKDIRAALATLNEESRSRLTGIGLAQPFNLGSWLNELGLPKDSFKLWDDYDFAANLENEFQIPVTFENDGNAAAIAELFYGVGCEIDDFLYLYFGPAVGGGLVLKGDVVRGHTGNAADLGLMPVPPSKLSTATKPKTQWDILLNRASLNSLRRHLKKTMEDAPIISRSSLEMVVAQGGKEVTEWFEDCVDALVPAIMASAALLDVPTMVIGANIGGEFSEKLTEKLTETLSRNMPESRFAPKLLPSTFGSDAAAIGAASIPIFYSFSPRKPITK